MKQSELALKAGISPSYLNLIEHNRRRIGGALLLTIARELDVEPALLSEGAEARVVASLREAAAEAERETPEIDRVEEFAGSFPGWARVLVAQHRRVRQLERAVEGLTDRLAHDPQLAASLHEVLSTVTAIHSTASILTDDAALEPEWRARFNRNLSEDSARLAEGAAALVRYLDTTDEQGDEIMAPQDEMQAFFRESRFHFPALERDGAGRREIEALIAAAPMLRSRAGRQLAGMALARYRRDARRMPLTEVVRAVREVGLRPEVLAPRFNVSLTQVFRRLAEMPEEEVGPVGLVIADGAGALLFRKPVAGFTIPRGGGACPLWPLYLAFGQPYVPMRHRLLQAGRGHTPVRALTVAEPVGQAGFGTPPPMRAHMLLLPDDRDGGAEGMGVPLTELGATCRICPRADCHARREPSIMTEALRPAG